MDGTGCLVQEFFLTKAFRCVDGTPPALRVGANRLLAYPGFVPEVVGIRRPSVQIKGIEKGDLLKLRGLVASSQVRIAERDVSSRVTK